MPVISDEQARTVAQGIQTIGGVSNYGGGSGEYAPHEARYAMGALKSTPSQSLLQKIVDVGKQTGRIVGGAIAAGGKFVAHTVEDVGRTAKGVANTAAGEIVQPAMLKRANDINQALDKTQANIVANYKSGKMSKENYTKALQAVSKARQDNNKQNVAPVVNGPSPTARAGELVETAANILTLGRGTTVKALSEKGVKTALTPEAETRFAKLGATLEDKLTQIPALRNLVERNAAALAKPIAGETVTQAIARQSKQVAIGLLLKRPIFYQQNIEMSKDIYDDLLTGNYGPAAAMAALQASQMLEGGPIGAFLRNGKRAFGKLGELSYGQGSVIDNLSREIGTKHPTQIADYLQSLPKESEEFKNAERIYRIMQETNLKVADENVSAAVSNILRNYDAAGIDRAAISPQKLVEDYGNWHEAAQLVNNLAGKKIPGLDQEKIRNLVVVRWDSVMKRGLASAIESAGNDRNAMADVLTKFADETTNGWANNPTLMAQLTRVIDEAGSAQEAASRIRSIPTALAIPKDIPPRTAKRLAELGYGVAVPEGGLRKTPIVDYNDTRKLISAVVKGEGDDVFDPTTAPQPVLGAMASALERFGLSPRAAAQTAYTKLSEAVANNLDELGVARGLGFDNLNGQNVKGGQVILSKLQAYVNNKKTNALGNTLLLGKARPALTDIRQLTRSEIQEALQVTNSEAKAISKAVMKGYTDVPLEFRGLGDKLVDYTYRFNPAHKYYSRIQSALRYSYNPFFQTQEGTETALLAGLQGGNRATNLVDHHLLWNKSREELNGAVKQLDESGIFSSSLGGEAAQDQILGRVTADITNAQKRDLAGLALDLAKRQGTDLNTLLTNNPEQIGDALRVIVQYPKRGVLASPLARTLSVAFFPMRYNAKVTQLAAEVLAKQPPSVQLATIHSLMNLKDFVQSDEGIRWQRDNADALQVFNWVTPVNSIAYAYGLLGHKPNSIAQLGQLGGLPFGVISQVLDSMGVINLNTPYVNPKTGDVLPKYIPETTKAKAATALTDLLGTMFTYPGRILGLPGKQATLRDAVRRFIDTNGSDFNIQDQSGRITPMQENLIRVLKGDTSKEAINALYNSPAPGEFDWYTLPPGDLSSFNLPGEQPTLSRAELANLKSGGRGKKAKPTAKPVGQL